MKLFHVSRDLMKDGHFSPRVPSWRSEDEDNLIKRICFSDTIQGAVSAAPWFWEVLECDNTGIVNIKIFILDTEKYENIRILSPEDIWDRVSDALETGEHWILNELFIEDISYGSITDFEIDEIQVPTKEATILAEQKFEGDFDRASMELYGKPCGSIVLATDIKIDIWK